jgi:hypothetical protein
MKILLFSVLLLPLFVSAQSGNVIRSGQMNSITILDPFQSANSGIEGSPYLPESNFAATWLILNGQQRQVQARYNRLTGQLEYIAGPRVLALTLPVNEFRMLSSMGDTLLFRRGYTSETARLLPSVFCEVLFAGQKSQLIRQLSISLRKNEDPMSSDFGKSRFEPKETYFVAVGTGTRPVVSTRTSILEAFPDSQRANLKALIDSRNEKIRSWASVKTLLAAYDAQP